MKNLTGKVALVTGGSRGIGAGIVEKLAAEGALVGFTYVHAENKANDLVGKIRTNGGRAIAMKADTATDTEVQAAIDRLISEYGTIDILVNNAGLYQGGAVDDPATNMADLNRMWAVNVHGVAHMVRYLAPLMKPGSRIISIGSNAGSRSPFSGISDYSATKAALAAYTRGWARDLAHKQITVNIIQPGLIETDLKPGDEDIVRNLLAPVALKRFGSPAEIGNVVAFLAGSEASYVTGATITVDGGWHA